MPFTNQDLTDLSNINVRLFWIRRRLIAATLWFGCVVLGSCAYFPLSYEHDSTVTVVEAILITLSIVLSFGLLAYASPWRFPFTQWVYSGIGWTACVSLLYFFFGDVGPFPQSVRLVVGSALISTMIGAYVAHILDGGPRSNERSLLLGPPP